MDINTLKNIFETFKTGADSCSITDSGLSKQNLSDLCPDLYVSMQGMLFSTPSRKIEFVKGFSIDMAQPGDLILSGVLSDEWVLPSSLGCSGDIKAKICISQKKDTFSAEFSFFAALNFSSGQFSVQYEYVSGQFRAEIQSKTRFTFDGLQPLLGDLEYTSFLPVLTTDYDIWGGLEIYYLSSILNFVTKSNQIVLGVCSSFSRDLVVVPNVIELKDLHAQFVYNHSQNNNIQSSFLCDLLGELDIKDVTLDFDIPIVDSGVQDLAIYASKGGGYPSLQDLLELAGIKEDVPILKDIAIKDVHIGVDFDNKKPVYLLLDTQLYVEFLDAHFDVSVMLPDFSFKGQLSASDKMDMTALLKKLGVTSTHLPQIDITEFGIGYCSQSYFFDLKLEDNWSIEIMGKEYAMRMVKLYLDHSPGGLSGRISSMFEIFGINMFATALYNSADNGFKFEGYMASGSEIKLSDIINDLFGEMKIDAGIAEIDITGLGFKLNTVDKSFSFDCSFQDELKIPVGSSDLAVPKGRFGLVKGQDVTIDMLSTIDIGTCGFDLNMSISSQKDFKIGLKALNGNSISITDMIDQFLPGTLQVPDDLLKIEFTDFSISKTGDNIDITADIDTKITLYDESFEVKKVSFYHHKVNAGDDWGIFITGGFDLKIAGKEYKVFGTLDITHDQQQTSLKFTPDSTLPAIPVVLPIKSNQGYMEFDLALADITFFDDKVKGAGLSIDSSLSYKNMFPVISKVLHDGIKSTVTISTKGVFLSVDEVINPITFDIKPPVGDMDFGNMSINFTDILLDLGEHISIMMDIDIALPQELNNVFGIDKSGEPCLKLFRVYDASKPDNNAVKIKFTASDQGIKATFLNSPIDPIAIDDGHCNFELGKDGEFGTIDLEIPVFSYDADNLSFAGSGGFTAKGLKLPMILFKKLFESFQMDAIAQKIPDGIPITGIDLFDTTTGKIKVDEVMTFIEKGIGTKLPQPVHEIVHLLDDITEGIPDRLVHYLNIDLPTSFYFRFNIKMDGDISLAVSVNDLDPFAKEKTDNPPIKLLLPDMGEFGPELVGIEFYGFSFGDVFDGALFSCSLDFVCDEFLIIPIILGLPVFKKELPQEVCKYLPDAKDFMSKLSIRDLLILIEYETEIPIPIPLFFKDIGLDYFSIEGIKIDIHFGFPMPGLDMGEALKIVQSLYSFFTDKKALMPTNPPEHFDIKFLLGESTSKDYTTGNPIVFALPKYMGSASLTIPYTQLSLYSLVAHAMNWIKTMTLNELVQAVDLKYRMGHQAISFFELDADMDWVISTPDEFRKKAYTELKLAEGSPEIDNILEIVPAHTTSSDQGLIAFFKGDLSIGSELSVNSLFALAVSRGFTSGFQFSEKIVDIEFDMEGSVLFKIPDKGEQNKDIFDINGKVCIKYKGTALFEEEGALSITDDGLCIKGHISAPSDLLPIKLDYDCTLYISKSKGLKFELDVDEDIKIGGVDILKGAEKIYLAITRSGFELDVSAKTTLFSTNKLDVNGVLSINSNGIGGKFIFKLDAADHLDLLGYHIKLDADESLIFDFTKERYVFNSKLNVPGFVDNASVTGELDPDLTGHLGVSIADLNLGIVRLSGMSASLVVAKVSSFNVKGKIHFWDSSAGVSLGVATDGSFSTTVTEKVSIGNPAFIQIQADTGVTISNKGGHLSITPSTPHLHIVGIPTPISNFFMTNETTRIVIPSLNVGLAVIKQAEYDFTIKSNGFVSLRQVTPNASCSLGIPGISTTKAAINNSYIDTNAQISGSMDAKLKVGPYTIDETRYSLKNMGGHVGCTGSTSLNLLGTSIGLDASISSSGYFSFGGHGKIDFKIFKIGTSVAIASTGVSIHGEVKIVWSYAKIGNDGIRFKIWPAPEAYIPF